MNKAHENISEDQSQSKSNVTCLPFRPMTGFSSPHIQTVMACFSRGGAEPPTNQLIIPIDHENALSCEVSTPPNWKKTDKTIVLLHGLGGCHQSSYMVRISRKIYEAGYRAVRINMRCCGSGKDLAKIPYHGGLSDDILIALKSLKTEEPFSSITLIGFSLGGNIALKLCGELGANAAEIIETIIAICPPIDLAETANIMALPQNLLYNFYYMRQLEGAIKDLIKGRSFSNIYEFDKEITAPNWGFSSPDDYYQQSSSRYFLEGIKIPCHILITADDPFINYKTCLKAPHSSHVKLWMSENGGHMGFFGWADEMHRFYWIDSLILRWVEGNFSFA